MKKVLLVLTSADDMSGHPTGYTLSEAADPWKVFRDAGHAVDFASIKGGTPPIDPNSERDEITELYENDATVQAGLRNTAKVEFVEADQYDAIYLVGGHGTMVDFRGNPHLQRLVREVFETGGVVSAVCHGPSGLLDVELTNGLRIVEGRKIAAFTDSEEAAVGLSDTVPFLLSSELDAQGAELVAAREDFEEFVTVDGNLVTGQNPASAAGVAKEVVKILTTLVRAEKAEQAEAAEELRAEKDAEKAQDEDSSGA